VLTCTYFIDLLQQKYPPIARLEDGLEETYGLPTLLANSVLSPVLLERFVEYKIMAYGNSLLKERYRDFTEFHILRLLNLDTPVSFAELSDQAAAGKFDIRLWYLSKFRSCATQVQTRLFGGYIIDFGIEAASIEIVGEQTRLEPYPEAHPLTGVPFVVRDRASGIPEPAIARDLDLTPGPYFQAAIERAERIPGGIRAGYQCVLREDRAPAWTHGFQSFLTDANRSETSEPAEYAHHLPAWLGDFVARMLDVMVRETERNATTATASMYESSLYVEEPDYRAEDIQASGGGTVESPLMEA
jgi:hypothetical protein